MLKLYPAYGRTYSLDEARTAFLAGSDFSITRGGGPYCSIRDFIKTPKNEVAAYDAVILVVYHKPTNSSSACVVTRDEMKETFA